MAIVCVVEGHGDVYSLPILIRRIADAIGSITPPEIPNPIRVPKGRLFKPAEFDRAIELAANKSKGGAVLVMFDADDDCPATIGPQLAERIRTRRPDVKSAVVLPNREFEAWFIASVVSLRGKRGLRGDVEPPSDSDLIRGAKEWLTRQRIDGLRYSETADQPALTALFDLDLARRSRSFDKCFREISRLVGGS